MIVALLLVCACAPSSDPPTDPPAEVHTLATSDGWQLGVPDTDPLRDHRPADAGCPVSAWGEEDGRLEVQMGVCDYAWLVQPLPETVCAGDTLLISAWHQGLDAPEPGEAHLALTLGDELLWQTWSAVPSQADLWMEEVVVQHTAPAGTELGVHLHNHGYNSWAVAPVELRTGPCVTGGRW